MPQFLRSGPAETFINSLVQALDLVDVGILMLDRDLRVSFLNRRHIELFGFKASFLTSGPSYRDLIDDANARGWIAVPEDEYQKFADEREAAVRHGSISPTQIKFLSGKRVLFSCVACRDGGRILTYTEISAELEREVGEVAEMLRADMRYQTETLEEQAAYLASLAEATEESARNVEAARQALERQLEEHCLLETELRRLASTDSLTGVLNRAGFVAAGQRLLDQDEDIAVLMLDVDYFKLVNDRYGHAAGDHALQHIAGLLRTEIRANDLLGRLGGEEFAVMIPSLSDEAAMSVADGLRRRVENASCVFDGKDIPLTISIGIAVHRAGDCQFEQVLAQADAALYQAKRDGRNRVVQARHLAA